MHQNSKHDLEDEIKSEISGWIPESVAELLSKEEITEMLQVLKDHKAKNEKSLGGTEEVAETAADVSPHKDQTNLKSVGSFMESLPRCGHRNSDFLCCHFFPRNR